MGLYYNDIATSEQQIFNSATRAVLSWLGTTTKPWNNTGQATRLTGTWKCKSAMFYVKVQTRFFWTRNAVFTSVIKTEGSGWLFRRWTRTYNASRMVHLSFFKEQQLSLFQRELTSFLFAFFFFLKIFFPFQNTARCPTRSVLASNSFFHYCTLFLHLQVFLKHFLLPAVKKYIFKP